MKKIITAAAVLMTLTLHAQNPAVTVQQSVGGNNSALFIAHTDGYGHFTVRLNITDAENCRTDIATLPAFYTIKGNSATQLAVLQAEDPTQPVEVRYGWDWVQGRLDAEPDSEYAYRLPVGVRRNVTVREVFAQEAGMAQANTVNFKMWELTANPKENAVYAMRGGEVISTSADGITIEHSDGTQAVYGGLRDIYVKAGEQVESEAVIGSGGSAGITVAVYAYRSNNRTHIYPQMMSQQEYLDPLFATRNGNQQLTDGASLKARTTKRK